MAHIIRSIKTECASLTYPKAGTLAKTTVAVLLVSIIVSMLIFLETAGVEKLIYLIIRHL